MRIKQDFIQFNIVITVISTVDFFYEINFNKTFPIF